jgi:hypothetical protein
VQTKEGISVTLTRLERIDEGVVAFLKVTSDQPTPRSAKLGRTSRMIIAGQNIPSAFREETIVLEPGGIRETVLVFPLKNIAESFKIVVEVNLPEEGINPIYEYSVE